MIIVEEMQLSVEILIALGGILTTIIVWLVRLEATAKRNTEELAAEVNRRTQALAELETRLVQQRSEDRKQRADTWEMTKERLDALQSQQARIDETLRQMLNILGGMKK